MTDAFPAAAIAAPASPTFCCAVDRCPSAGSTAVALFTSCPEASTAPVSSSSASAAILGSIQWSASVAAAAASAAATSPVGRGGFLPRLRRPPPPPPPPQRPTDHCRRRPAHWSVASAGPAASDFPASAEQRIDGGQSCLGCRRSRCYGSDADGDVEAIWHFLIRLLRG